MIKILTMILPLNLRINLKLESKDKDHEMIINVIIAYINFTIIDFNGFNWGIRPAYVDYLSKYIKLNLNTVVQC